MPHVPYMCHMYIKCVTSVTCASNVSHVPQMCHMCHICVTCVSNVSQVSHEPYVSQVSQMSHYPQNVPESTTPIVLDLDISIYFANFDKEERVALVFLSVLTKVLAALQSLSIHQSLPS